MDQPFFCEITSTDQPYLLLTAVTKGSKRHEVDDIPLS